LGKVTPPILYIIDENERVFEPERCRDCIEERKERELNEKLNFEHCSLYVTLTEDFTNRPSRMGTRLRPRPRRSKYKGRVESVIVVCVLKKSVSVLLLCCCCADCTVCYQLQ